MLVGVETTEREWAEEARTRGLTKEERRAISEQGREGQQRREK